MLKNGVMLNDRYEIVGVVGSGGMSDVYKAKCHKLNRYVAIKVLKKEFSDDKNFVEKFCAEAQSAACLGHPNIVNIYDVCEDNGLYYIVMELVEGITLKSYIKRKGRLEVKESISIAMQVAQGIRAAHMQHIIHRDIKPQNIIISKDGKVKVTDFGIAKVSSTQTISSNTMGSVHYISPEQARGGYVDERSDIYSLGISLYEMITGKVPFDSDTSVSVALMHIQNELPSPREIVPDLPISVEKIIYKCTQKKADRRYNDADALIEDLKTCLISTNSKTARSNFPDVNKNSNSSARKNFTEKEYNADKKAEDVSNTTLWTKQDLEREKRRKKDFLEKIYEEKKKNPILERILTGVTVLFAIAACFVLVYGIIWIKNTLTPPNILRPSTNESSSNNIPPGISHVKMPKLIGYDVTDAIIALNEINLKNDLSYDYSNVYNKGQVISQQYNEGTKLERNTVVKLVISLGRLEFEIGNYRAHEAVEIEEQLKAGNIKVNRVFVYDNEIEIGSIVSHEPENGTTIYSGDTVTLYISRGSELKKVTVPSLANYTVDEARKLLEAKGLILGHVSEIESKIVEAGKIYTQSYLANSVVIQGTEVDVVVSTGTPFPVTSLTLQKSAFTRYITSDSNEFCRPPAPGVISNTTYAYATVMLELEQNDNSGVSTTKTVGTYTIKPTDLPMQIDDIEGIFEDVYDGSISVYITLGEIRYKINSYYVEFK